MARIIPAGDNWEPAKKRRNLYLFRRAPNALVPACRRSATKAGETAACPEETALQSWPDSRALRSRSVFVM